MVVGGVESDVRVFLRSFDPSLLWTGTAIGVSHLVSATRAGADGLAMALRAVAAVLLVSLLF